jgi:hypothetical protein
MRLLNLFSDHSFIAEMKRAIFYLSTPDELTHKYVRQILGSHRLPTETRRKQDSSVTLS